MPRHELDCFVGLCNITVILGKDSFMKNIHAPDPVVSGDRAASNMAYHCIPILVEMPSVMN